MASRPPPARIGAPPPSIGAVAAGSLSLEVTQPAIRAAQPPAWKPYNPFPLVSASAAALPSSAASPSASFAAASSTSAVAGPSSAGPSSAGPSSAGPFSAGPASAAAASVYAVGCGSLSPQLQRAVPQSSNHPVDRPSGSSSCVLLPPPATATGTEDGGGDSFALPLPAAATSTERGGGDRGGRDDEEDRLCSVCLEAPKCILLAPCGHVVLCHTCVKDVRAANNLVRGCRCMLSALRCSCKALQLIAVNLNQS